MDTIVELREHVRGPVIEPGDDGYDEQRRVHNGMHDRNPALIARAASTADAVAVVNYAREAGLDLAVRGGGHSAPGFGTCDGGVVLDLGLLNNVFVDPGRRTARVGGGATWGDVNHATHAYGLATTGGIISTTGVSGLTLGGGVGYLTRGCGLSCDNLVSAEVVTADGRIMTASEYDNEDLFWALRGGSGNFGVATSLEFALHDVGMIYGGPMLYEVDDAPAVMRAYDDYIQEAPGELGAFFGWQMAPPLPFIPEDRHGDVFCAVVTCWSGRPEQGEHAIKPFRDVAEVKAELVGPMPYPVLNSAFDALFFKGIRQYWKSDFVRELPDEAIAGMSSTAPGRRPPRRRCTCTPSTAPPAGSARRRRRSAIATPGTPWSLSRMARSRRRRGEHPLGARLLRCRPPLLGHRRWIRQLHVRRRRRTRTCELRPDLRAAASGEGHLRPGESLPREPEHPPCHVSMITTRGVRKPQCCPLSYPVAVITQRRRRRCPGSRPVRGGLHRRMAVSTRRRADRRPR